jgi:hypothetical protein
MPDPATAAGIKEEDTGRIKNKNVKCFSILKLQISPTDLSKQSSVCHLASILSFFSNGTERFKKLE